MLTYNYTEQTDCCVCIYSHSVQDGATPLFMASQEGHTDVVDILIQAKANVNQAKMVNVWIHVRDENSVSVIIRHGEICREISPSTPSLTHCLCGLYN